MTAKNGQPQYQARCQYALRLELNPDRKRWCPEKAEPGYMLCARHRQDGLARVLAMQEKR